MFYLWRILAVLCIGITWEVSNVSIWNMKKKSIRNIKQWWNVHLNMNLVGHVIRFFIFILLFVTYICFWRKKIQNYKHNLALCSFRYRKCDVKYISFCPGFKYTHIWTCLPFCWVIKKMKLEMLLFIFIVKYMWFTVIQMYLLISQMISTF